MVSYVIVSDDTNNSVITIRLSRYIDRAIYVTRRFPMGLYHVNNCGGALTFKHSMAKQTNGSSRSSSIPEVVYL
jgi:hypothetical protein